MDIIKNRVKSVSSAPTQTQQTETQMNVIDSDNNNSKQSKKSEKRNVSNKRILALKMITFKYTVLTFVAGFSTVIILLTISVIGSGTIIVLDYTINAFCLILMSQWYGRGKWFDILCCGVIKCTSYSNIYKGSLKQIMSRQSKDKSIEIQTNIQTSL